MSTSQTYGTGQAGGAQGTGTVAKDQASQVGQSAGQAASQVADTSKQQVQQVASEASQQARDLAGELKSQVTTQAGTQRDRAVGSLHSLSDELEKMARGEGGGEGIAAEVARQAAERARQVAGFIEGREPGELVQDLRSYAARRPMAFLVGAAVAGLVAGRLTRGTKDAHSKDKAAQGMSGTYGTSPAPYAAGPAPYAGTVAPPLATSVHGQSAEGLRSPATGPLTDPAADDVLDLDAPAGLGRAPRSDLPGGGTL